MKINQEKLFINLFLVVALIMFGQAWAGPEKAKKFGIGAPRSIADLPVGVAKTRIDALDTPAQQRALQWLQTFSFPVNDLKHIHFDRFGGVLYVDDFQLENVTVEDTAVSSPQSIPAEKTFFLDSKPGATNKVFLDFDGHVLAGTAWNASSGVDSYTAQPYDVDGLSSSFSEQELRNIQEIWHRVAEDFAPFNIDVTTQDPGTFNSNTGRILITASVDADGKLMPHSSAGGVAYLGVWGMSSYPSYYSPALVYFDNLGGGYPPYVSEAASHELGHNLALSHDGTSTSGYYTGHGDGYVSWAPIMGVGYYTHVTQWSNGNYLDANNDQDDIGILGNKLGFRPDDHSVSPTPLVVESDGSILVTTPENDDPDAPSLSNKGIISSTGDVDLFTFNAAAGPVNIVIEPAWKAYYQDYRRGSNLDIQATLYDPNDNYLNTFNPLDETSATIQANLPIDGSYTLAINGVGNDEVPYSEYGSLGMYFISGTVTPLAGGDNNNQDNNFQPPPKPVGFSVADNNNGSATLNWIGDDSATAYEIQREKKHKKRNSYVDTVLFTVSENVSYIDAPGSGEYRYQVRAENAVGQSDWTSWIVLTITDSSKQSGSGGGKCHPKRGC